MDQLFLLQFPPWLLCSRFRFHILGKGILCIAQHTFFFFEVWTLVVVLVSFGLGNLSCYLGSLGGGELVSKMFG